MLDALAALPAGQVASTSRAAHLPRLEEMVSAVRRAGTPYHLLHFNGHGAYLPLTGVGALCFEDGEARTDLVAAGRLGDLLARLDVPLVLLESCHGADLSEQPVFGWVAPALLASGVGSVVAFSHAVHVEAARLLVERLYRELSPDCRRARPWRRPALACGPILPAGCTGVPAPTPSTCRTGLSPSSTRSAPTRCGRPRGCGLSKAARQP